MTETKYGFYSKKAEEEAGATEWLGPNGPVRCTCVDSRPDAPDHLWDDKVACGPVTEFVRRVSKGQCRKSPYSQNFNLLLTAYDFALPRSGRDLPVIYDRTLFDGRYPIEGSSRSEVPGDTPNKDNDQ